MVTTLSSSPSYILTLLLYPPLVTIIPLNTSTLSTRSPSSYPWLPRPLRLGSLYQGTSMALHQTLNVTVNHHIIRCSNLPPNHTDSQRVLLQSETVDWKRGFRNFQIGETSWRCIFSRKWSGGATVFHEERFLEIKYFIPRTYDQWINLHEDIDMLCYCN